jgi:hypothetical protein
MLLLSSSIASNLVGQGTNQAINCVNGAPTLSASDGKAAHEALDSLLWRSSFHSYAVIVTTSAPLAGFDTIVNRGERLLALTRQHDSSTLAPTIATLRQLLSDERSRLGSSLTLDGRSLLRPVDARSLKIMSGGIHPGRYRMGDVDVDIDSANQSIAVSVCALASTAARYLEYLVEPQLKVIATNYATAAAHWQLFVDEGYSMTLVERLGASCRLWIIGWIIDPLRDCSQRPNRSLEPPTAQVVFVHPTVGLAPIFKGDSTVQHLAIVEWYGFLHNSYSSTKITSFGLAIASSYFEVGRSGLGGVLKSPWGTVGVFDRKADRALVTVSADVLGWVPGIRKAAATLRITTLQNAVAGLSAAP